MNQVLCGFVESDLISLNVPKYEKKYRKMKPRDFNVILYRNSISVKYCHSFDSNKVSKKEPLLNFIKIEKKNPYLKVKSFPT